MSERSGTTAQMPSTRTTTTETAAQTSVRSILPNLPEPINGAMKAYDYSHRTFSRPYSAKTVFFYKEGDSYFTGLRVPVSKSRYRNIESLLDDLNSSISMPFGVRRLTTPSGKTVIHSIDQLQHLGRYIAATTNHRSIRPLDLDEIESIQRGRHPIRHHRKSHAVVSSNNESSHLPNAKLPRPKDNRSCGISRLPLTAKQILFVLNGKPSKIYRGILNPSRMKTFDSLLQEVSEGLQIAIFKLYTYDGKRITSFNDLLQLKEPRVLAVPRNERPNVTRVGALPRLQEFPMIAQNINPKKTIPQAVSQRTPSPYADNSIERPNRIGSKHQRMPLTRANNKREKEKISTPETESEFRTVAETNSAKESSNKSKTISNEDDDSGRPQSNDELFLESGVRGDIVSGIEGSSEDEEEEGSESGIQVKIADDEMKHKRGSDTVSSSNEKKCEAERQKVASAQHVGDENEETLNEGRREGKDDAERKSEEEQKVDDVDGNAESLEKAAITIQSAYRGYRTRRNLKNKKLRFTAVDDHQDQEKAVSTSGGCPGSAQPVDENNAATVIQAQWRGYQTRKLFSTEGALPTEDKLMSQAEIDEIGMQQEAAMTIQSVWRGYRVRKQLKKDGLLPLKSQRNLESVRNAEDTSDDQEVSVNEYNEVNKLPEEKEAVAESEQTDAVDSGEADEEETTGTTYTVSILTGNRWAADTDNDLYITLYGNKDVSGKHYLRQEVSHFIAACNEWYEKECRRLYFKVEKSRKLPK
ncbi:hypothetical protein AB6A40_002804 [Gnathostoma spinigerum]|uniref:Doublecortin domain-containing protein n=1 Tax=Gnathostoma spinigerum TaxID=75299 RepID=A0ABD6EIG9_9BILA